PPIVSKENRRPSRPWSSPYCGFWASPPRDLRSLSSEARNFTLHVRLHIFDATQRRSGHRKARRNMLQATPLVPGSVSLDGTDFVLCGNTEKWEELSQQGRLGLLPRDRFSTHGS